MTIEEDSLIKIFLQGMFNRVDSWAPLNGIMLGVAPSVMSTNT